MNKFKEYYTKDLKKLAENNPYGNPFSAKIVNLAENLSLDAVNTAKHSLIEHAEINAINKMFEKGWQPQDCIIISSGEPCLMCISAIAWSGIKTVYYLNDYTIANKQGFKWDCDCQEVNKKYKLGLRIIKL
jgi:tRNA(Arg) A34 adenosine deaminase TadA